LAKQQLARARSPWRLWRNPRSSFVWVRCGRAGLGPQHFSLAPLLRDRVADIDQAVAWCLLSAQQGRWLGPVAAKAPPRTAHTWGGLAELVCERITTAIPKRGSRVHLLNDLRFRIAQLSGRPNAQALAEWVRQCDPLLARRSFNRRLDVLSWIDRVVPELQLQPLLAELRASRPRGAAVRLAAAQGQRVRLVPEDAAIETWLDGLDGFNQWVFAALATYGLRPHELWHIEALDERGWVTIPGEMRTKSARAHFAPPVPQRWVERYELPQQWPGRRAELLDRWPVKWEQRGGVRIPVNNAELGQYLRKQFALRGVQPLVAPLADGEGTDWLRPYDLRHCYAIRCATSCETDGVDPELHADWMGHTWDVHQRIYLRWLPPSRMRQHRQHQLATSQQPRATAGLDAGERQELQELRQQLAAVQQLLTGRPS
jgi:integrase